MAQKQNRTEINSLGEFGLIERLSQLIQLRNPTTVQGIGDDAAVFNHKQHSVVSSDLLVEAIHFDLSFTPLKHLGFKAVAVNVSDIVAMNALPTQIIADIGLSNRFSVEAVEELYKGMEIACEAYGADLAGGDTTSSYAGLAISITAIGQARKQDLVYRKGAKVNDVICVTGDLGAAFLGLKTLQREKEVFKANPEMQPQLEDSKYTVMRQLKPEARADLIHEFRELDVRPSAMIDLSDGLASDLQHICRASDVGALLLEEHVPIDKQAYEAALSFNMDPITAALNGGEDYELCFTIDPKTFEKIEHLPDITPIGVIKDKKQGMQLKTRGEQVIPLQAQGWTAF